MNTIARLEGLEGLEFWRPTGFLGGSGVNCFYWADE